MTFEEVRNMLFNATSEEEKADALIALDDLHDELEKAHADLKAANAKLFTRYGQVGEFDETDEEVIDEVEDAEEDIVDILEGEETESDEITDLLTDDEEKGEEE